MSRNLFPINNVSSTQGFWKYYYAPTYFLELQASSLPIDEVKTPLTISSKHEDSNSILLSSVHCWNSEVCIPTSILWIDKLLWTVSYTSPSFHFHQMEILLSSMFHISWLKYVLIASSTRTDFKHRYDENNLIVVNSWTCYFNKSSFMDKTFYPYQF